MSLQVEIDRLVEENASLKRSLIRSTDTSGAHSSLNSLEDLQCKALSVIVIGASGDLAKKKTYPALFQLFKTGLLPGHAKIVGFSRSNLSNADLHDRIRPFLKGSEEDMNRFLSLCSYFSGHYDSDEAFASLNAKLNLLEQESFKDSNRLFYFAIPPSVFVEAGSSLKSKAMTCSGWNRIVVEKPFGRDSASSAELSRELLSHFDESQLFRIDHYLGKEMVQNLMVLRFANTLLEPLWNSNYISNVSITFKEDFGTKGRGGYFDHYGILRDIQQNHLLQVLTLLAMEVPVSLDAEDVRNEKVRVLRCIDPIKLENCVLGQYMRPKDGSEPGYLENEDVPETSVTPTFAQTVLFINNSRWSGVPFILKSGKALNERKAEIRVQFKEMPGRLFGQERNELVIRIQPNESIYWKILTKEPGLSKELHQVELDLTYDKRFNTDQLPDAYERLLLDVLRGDHNLFVRNDELVAAWSIFTPLLHRIEQEKIKPLQYEFGSRGPAEADELSKKFGFRRSENYRWTRSVL